MNPPTPRVAPFGEAAVLVEYANGIDPALNRRVHRLATRLAAGALPGTGESVPAYASLLVTYDPEAISTDELCRALSALALTDEAGRGKAANTGSTQVHTVPTLYGGEAGPDLAEVAAIHGLTPQRVIALHAGEYTVFMLGFSPGFAYMGALPKSIATPRLATPRPLVPAGSVGIAEGQTGIYPQATPGGWRLIGRTSLNLFDPDRDPPSLFAPGDRVRFVPVAELPPAAPPAPTPYLRQAPAHGPAPLEVLAGGVLATVQDLGRPSYARFGVPTGGAVDPWALQAANALVGNPPDAAGIELAVGGQALRFSERALIALAGADLQAVLYTPDLGAWEVPLYTACYVRASSRLECTTPRTGCRAYLAVAGGVDVPPVLGARATYLPGRFGGLAGRALASGDRLPLGAAPPDLAGRAGRWLPPAARPAYSDGPTVRLVAGPHAGHFAPGALEKLLSEAYAVTAASNRMGLRLRGPALPYSAGGGGLVSLGMPIGAVQVPPDGQPVVLLADHQTAGGYPVIGVVARADLPLLAQCLPGQSRVHFELITLQDAQALWRSSRVPARPELLGGEAVGWAPV